MKQSLIALLLVLALVSTVAASAFATEIVPGDGETAQEAAETVQAEESEAPANNMLTLEITGETAQESAEELPGVVLDPDTAKAIRFAELEELIKENNLSYKSLALTDSYMSELEDAADALKSGIEGLKIQIAGLNPADENYAAHKEYLEGRLEGMQQQLSGMSSMIQDTTQMEAGRKQLIYGAENLFIALVGMEQQEVALERQLAALDRTVEELKVRANWGQISELQLMEMASGRASLVSGLATLKMNITSYKMQLEQMIGEKITGSLVLGELPAVTEETLDALDPEADLKLVMSRSYDIQAASNSEDKVNEMASSMAGIGDAVSDMQDAAYYTHKETIQQVEMKFRVLYAQLQDCRQILTAKETALEYEKLAYQAEELKYQQGTIPQNALLTAEDELQTAKEAVVTAKNNLFSTYNNYRWAVDRGILN